MTDASKPPKIPWWVNYWTDATTTRSSLRQGAWLFFVMAAACIGFGTLYLFWRPAWMGVVVLPVVFGVMPVGFTLAGIWTMVAARWIDRHRAWDRLATKQERETYEERQSLWTRCLPLGLFLLAVGGAVGTLVGWVWKTEVGIPLGIAFGALGGFVSGIVLAGFREGVQSRVEKPAEVKSQAAEQSPAADGGRNAGSS